MLSGDAAASIRRYASGGGHVSRKGSWSGRERRSTRWCGRSPTASSPVRCARAKSSTKCRSPRASQVSRTPVREALGQLERHGACRQAAQSRRHRRRRDAGTSVLDVRKHGRAGRHLRALLGGAHDRRRAPRRWSASTRTRRGWSISAPKKTTKRTTPSSTPGSIAAPTASTSMS